MASYNFTNGITTLDCDGFGWASAIIPLEAAPAGTKRMRFAYRAYFDTLLYGVSEGGNLPSLDTYLVGSLFGLSFEAKSPALEYPGQPNGNSYVLYQPAQFERFVGWANNWTNDSASQSQAWGIEYDRVMAATKTLDSRTWARLSGAYTPFGDTVRQAMRFFSGRTGMAAVPYDGTPPGTSTGYINGPWPLAETQTDAARWTTGSTGNYIIPETIFGLPSTPAHGAFVTQGWEISASALNKQINLTYYVDLNSLANVLDVFVNPTYPKSEAILISADNTGNSFTADGLTYSWPRYITMRMGHPGKMILEKHAVEYFDQTII